MTNEVTDYVVKDRDGEKIKGGDVVEYHSDLNEIPVRKGIIIWSSDRHRFVLKIEDDIFVITKRLGRQLRYLKIETEQRREHFRQRIKTRQRIRDRR